MKVINLEWVTIGLTFVTLCSIIYFVTAAHILYRCFLLIFIFFIGMCFFFVFNVPFLGLLILMVYIGAIATLFLYIILMIDFYIEFKQKLSIEKIMVMMTLGLLIGLWSLQVYYSMMTIHGIVDGANRTLSFDEYWGIEEAIISRSPQLSPIGTVIRSVNEPMSVSVSGLNSNGSATPESVVATFEVFKEVLLTATSVQYLPEQTVWDNFCLDIVLIGKVFYTYYSMVFLLCGVTLFLAIVGVLISAEWSFSRKSGPSMVLEHKQVAAQQINKLYTYYMETQAKPE